MLQTYILLLFLIVDVISDTTTQLPIRLHQGKNTTIDNANFTFWCTGDCENVDNSQPHSDRLSLQGGTLLMGGGTDTDDGFKEMIKWSGNGKFLVLRASGTDAYNPYIRGLGNTVSVTTLLTKQRAAAYDERVLDVVRDADAIFFAGGDQYVYLTEWANTPLNEVIQHAITNRRVPVGGTSAGCDIQGGAIYTAANDTVESAEALKDPYNFRVTVQNHSFINHPGALLARMIIDTHFITRDRMGRLVTFVARLWQQDTQASRPVYALGIDEQTAIAIDGVGMGKMLMQGKSGGRAFVLTPSHGAEVCAPGHALQYDDIAVQKLDAYYGDTYDFARMAGGDKTQRYHLSARQGTLTPKDPYGPP
eukprot:m.234974 g.234974  ORF g.234974 m.234974 type:complete len:363 (+) comp19327_c0_seq8:148-1236(+)